MPKTLTAPERQGADNKKPKDLTSKQVFTTGEAAKICKVSQQTIIRSFDSGRLNGFRVPGSRFRRIPRRDLIRFMRAHNFSPDSFAEIGEIQEWCILVIGSHPLASVLQEDDRFNVRVVSPDKNAPSAFTPDLVLVGNEDSVVILRFIEQLLNI